MLTEIHVFHTSNSQGFDAKLADLVDYFPREKCMEWFSIKNDEHRKLSMVSKSILLKGFKSLSLDPNILKSYHTSSLGKPDVIGDVYFSISHCQGSIAVVIAPEAIGLDVEVKIEKPLSVLSRVCLNEELSFFESKEKLWTRKEAVVKLFGDSILNGKRYDVRGGESSFYVKDLNLNPYVNCAIATKSKLLKVKICQL